MSKETELGTLVVVMLKAKNLNDKHAFYKQDVFAQATLNGVTQKTPVDIRGGQHPVWDAEVRFPIMKQAVEENRNLQVACYAQERKSDDLLGKGSVDITETLRTGEFDDWVSLSINGVVRGDVYLEMTYFPHHIPQSAANLGIAGAGIKRRPSKFGPSERLARSQDQILPSGQRTDSKPYHGQRVANEPRHGQSPPQSPKRTPIKRSDSPLPPIPDQSLPSPLLPGSLQAGPGGARPKVHIKAQSTVQNTIPLTLQEILSDPSPSPSTAPSIAVPEMLRPGSKSRILSGSGYPTPQASPPRTPPVAPSPGAFVPPTLPYPSSTGTSRVLSGGGIYSPLHVSPSRTPPIAAAPPAPSTGYGQLHDAVPGNAPVGLSSYIPASATPFVSYRQAGSVPPIWELDNSPAGPISFPLAANPAPSPFTAHIHSVPQFAQQVYHDSDPVDPYLQARYQTPLPLPQTPRSGSPPRQVRSNADPSRIEAIRLAEEEAARRKEQTEKDLEFALQLDRELNSGT